jgi:hypothetical protein
LQVMQHSSESLLKCTWIQNLIMPSAPQRTYHTNELSLSAYRPRPSDRGCTLGIRRSALNGAPSHYRCPPCRSERCSLCNLSLPSISSPCPCQPIPTTHRRNYPTIAQFWWLKQPELDFVPKGQHPFCFILCHYTPSSIVRLPPRILMYWRCWGVVHTQPVSDA